MDEFGMFWRRLFAILVEVLDIGNRYKILNLRYQLSIYVKLRNSFFGCHFSIDLKLVRILLEREIPAAFLHIFQID